MFACMPVCYKKELFYYQHLLVTICCVLQDLEFIMVGKSGQQDVTDDDAVNHSSQLSEDAVCSGDSHNHRLLSRKTRLV